VDRKEEKINKESKYEGLELNSSFKIPSVRPVYTVDAWPNNHAAATKVKIGFNLLPSFIQFGF